jgi:ABC-type uncharacterized transport system substrate-binding protein
LIYRQTISSLADRYHLSTIYPFRIFVEDGGLSSYGIDLVDLFRGAALYIDRVLKGAKPNELPFSYRPSSSWQSTSRPPRRSVSMYRRRCPRAPTR